MMPILFVINHINNENINVIVNRNHTINEDVMLVTFLVMINKIGSSMIILEKFWMRSFNFIVRYWIIYFLEYIYILYIMEYETIIIIDYRRIGSILFCT